MWLPEKKGSCISPVIFYTSKVDTILLHFKELFALDGKQTNISVNDLSRRNTIANLLQDWGLVKIMSESPYEAAPLSQIKILTYKEKSEWLLETKYNIGKKKRDLTNNGEGDIVL